VQLLTTVGSASDATRHAAARALSHLAGAGVLVLLGLGHLPQLEDPAAYADLIRAVAAGAP
jgi:pimeloyl-ACP methyl ester carboxylesterase